MIESEKSVSSSGITVLPLDISQEAITRLGPPPGNAETLIRGGAGWIFGITSREDREQPGLTRWIVGSPSPDEVSRAFVRELAWRWVHQRPPFLGAPPTQKSDAMEVSPGHTRYVDAERGFVTQALGLTPKRFVPSPDERESPPQQPKLTSECACLDGLKCCAGSCLKCQEK